MSIQKCIAVIKKANKSGTIDDDAAMKMLEEIDEFITNVKNADNVDQELMTHLTQQLSDSMLAAKIEKRNENGSIDAVIFQKEFSGILTGNLGKS